MSPSEALSTRGTFDLYLAFGRNAFLTMLAYRLRYYMGILTYLLFVSVHYFIWQAVYAGKGPGAALNGFTLEEMVTYVAVGWIARSFYFSNIDEEVDDIVTSGQVGNYLIRPVDFQVMLYARAIGESLFRLLFFCVPILLVVTWVFPIAAPASSEAFLLFSLSTVLGFFVLAGINFTIGLSAFYLKSIRGLMRAKYFIVQLFSGLLLPISFFPQWLRSVVDLLPFKAVAFVPLQLYLGKIQSDKALFALASQLIWIVVLFVFGRWYWLRAARRLTVQGG